MMKLICISDLNKITPTKAINTVQIIQPKEDCSKKESDTNQNVKSNLSINQNNKISAYLNIETIRKMINRFLVENKMSKESLAAALEIRAVDLDQLIFQEELPPRLIPKVNLPLIKLYCETKFPAAAV